MRLRVLRIIARMNVGGPALQVVGLMRGLDSDRFESRLLAGTVEEGEEDYIDLRAPDVSVVKVGGLGRSVRLGGDIRAFGQVARHIRSFRPHIIHTHTAKAGVLGRLAPRGGALSVHTFHGHLLRGYFSPLVVSAVTQVERRLARRTDTLTAVGKKVRDELLAAGIGQPNQYVVVPPGVEIPTPISRAEARQRLGLPVDAPVIAFVARLTKIKRPDRALEVMRLLGERVPDSLLVIAGEGPLYATLRKDAADMGSRVRFLGWRSDVAVIYSAADVMLSTSDNEGMPVALIEGAMCGVPAVATDVGSTSEVVISGVTGRVTGSNSRSLADAIWEIICDEPTRVTYGKQARHFAIQQFSINRLVADTEALYEDLVALRSREP